MSTAKPTVIGVVAVSSPAYVRCVLELTAENKTVVPLRSSDDRERIEATGVSQVLTPEDGFGWLDIQYTPTSSDAVAQISFTSGTEGAAKGVHLSHGAFADTTYRLNDVMELNSEVREYIGVPVYHSFGFGRCRAVAHAGGKGYIPRDGFNPLEAAEMLKDGEINAISAVPSLWRTVLDAAELFENCGEKLRWIEIGSQYMSREEKEALKALFPNARIVQHYGLTEASRSTFLKIHEVEGEHLESVGKPTGQVEVQISQDQRIMIRGPHVTELILVEGELQSPLDENGWYTTSDRGALHDGFLYYEGRADDIINCGGLKLSPERLEASIRAQGGVTEPFAICRISDRMRGDGILLALAGGAAQKKQTILELLRKETQNMGINAQGAIRVCEVAVLPMTASGKVQRSVLSRDYQDAPLAEFEVAGARGPNAGVGEDADLGDTSLTEKERELLAIWGQALGTKNLGVNESFYDLGGDSVTALGVVVRMSRAGIDLATCRRILQGATIRELAQTAQANGNLPTTSGAVPTAHREYINTLLVNALRGMLVLAVITGHWSDGAIERLPASFGWLAPALAPYFSFGTPGFAIVFGVGFGYLYLHRIQEHSDRVWAAMRLGTLIVGGGVALLAAFRLAATEEVVTNENFFEYFFSPLMFYFLALPTMPLWGRLSQVAGPSRQLPIIVALVLLCHGIELILQAVVPTEQPDGFLRLARLMLVAKFSYFAMMKGVLAGIGAGAYLRTHVESAHLSRPLVGAGLATVLIGLLIGGTMGQLHYFFTWPSPLTSWKWLVYFGVILLLLALLFNFRHDYPARGRLFRQAMEALGTVGQLALPFYVFHEIIIPFKAVLHRLGLPDGAATGTSLLVFFVVSYLMIKRVRSLFHSS